MLSKNMIVRKCMMMNRTKQRSINSKKMSLANGSMTRNTQMCTSLTVMMNLHSFKATATPIYITSRGVPLILTSGNQITTIIHFTLRMDGIHRDGVSHLAGEILIGIITDGMDMEWITDGEDIIAPITVDRTMADHIT